MTLDEIKPLAGEFFEWPGEPTDTVTLTSAILFARYVVEINNASAPDLTEKLMAVTAELADTKAKIRELVAMIDNKAPDLMYRKLLELANT